MQSEPATHFDPTMDEVATLKHIELHGPMPLATALKRHLPPRLTEHGYLARGAEGSYVITERGRELIRRMDS
jgi:hypothetical protein